MILNPAGRMLLGLDSQEEAHGMSLLEYHAPRTRKLLIKTAMPGVARDGSLSGDPVCSPGTEGKSGLRS